MPPAETRLSLVKLFLELELFTPALQVLQGIMSEDDQDVEAWYLEGWCFFLMAEKAKEAGSEVEGLGWQELAQDARDCLETCQTVSMLGHDTKQVLMIAQLHVQQTHPDLPMLEHVRELTVQLEAAGITPSAPDEGQDDADVEEWEDASDDEGEEMDMA
jgi:hypothetical protein